MKLTLKIIALVFIAFIFTAKPAEAKTAGSSAVLISSIPVRDRRADILKAYLQKYDSPLAPYAKTFIDEADKNKLDWKLVVSIAGVESYFGQQIPFNSYNGWGYGVYGANVINFNSWNDGIQTVSGAIRSDYINNWGASNVYEIGSIYAADPMWAQKVTRFISELEEFESQKSENGLLSISL